MMNAYMKDNSMKIVSISTSRKKGTRKTTVDSAEVLKDHGLKDDAHAGDWHRQVSLLGLESIRKIQVKGLDVSAGDFAENITTRGVPLASLPLGTRLRIGSAVLKVTQIGKECHNRCAIYYKAGDCIMPREGVFARVLHGGRVACGDTIAEIKKGGGPVADHPKNR